MKAKVTLKLIVVTNNIMILVSLKMTFYSYIICILTIGGCARLVKNMHTMQVLQEVLFQFALVSAQNIQYTHHRSTKIQGIKD